MMARTLTNQIKFALILGTVLVTTVSCITIKKTAWDIGRKLDIIDQPAPVAPKEAPAQFRDALVLIKENKFSEGLEKLEAFLLADPTSQWTQAALYHEGRALEGLERWDEAAAKYRKVIAATTSQAPKLQSLSLYRMSFCHEALGDDQATLADLHDLIPRSKGLPNEVRDAELPARMAGAYARVGNFDGAVEFYKKAEAGVAHLRSQSGEKVPEWLPRTLYYMGTVPDRAIGWDDFETALRPLARSQVYLLEAAELGALPWSEKAETDLISQYNLLWKTIESPPAIDKPTVPQQRALLAKQWERGDLLRSALEELRARAMSTEPQMGSENSHHVIEFIQDMEKKIATLYTTRPPGQGPTAEALARQNGIRGRVITPDDSLEEKFLQEAKTAKPTKALPIRATKKAPEAEEPEDPNL